MTARPHSATRNRLLRVGVGLIAALGLWLALPARPAHAFEIAVQDDPIFLYRSSFPRELAFARARQVGATYIRANVISSDWVRLGPGAYESLVQAAAANGLRVHFTLMGTPRQWSGDRRLNFRNPSVSLFGRFAGEVAGRFRGRVARYSLWNEPNLVYYLSPQSSAPAIYRNLYRAGWGAIKSADPGAQVLIGELFSGATLRLPGGRHPLAFLRLAARGLRSDGLAYHPFQYNFAPAQRNRRYVGVSSIATIRSTLRTLARRGALRTPRGGTLPIHFTEFGYQVGGPWRIRGEARRASFTLGAFRLAKRQGVSSMLYYHLVRNYLRSWDSGMVNANGSPTPVFRALTGARRSLVGR